MISLCIKVNDDDVLDYLKTEIEKSTISKITCKKCEFKAFKNVIVHYKGSDTFCFYDFISNVLTKAITLFFEDSLVRDLIDLNYFYFTEPDKKVIFEEYKLLVNKMPDPEGLYDDLIFPYVRDYIIETGNSNERLYNFNHKNLVLTGFINFRLKDLLECLEEFVSESVNQFIIDKEYIKFVDLLNNYVSSKIPNDLILNLIYINSEGILLNSDGEFVELEKFNSQYLSDITFSKNDYILNTLVGLLPSKIMVHLISPEDQFIKTIELIFEEKVEVCEGCDLCRAYELLNLH